jgi:hypothetical protein
MVRFELVHSIPSSISDRRRWLWIGNLNSRKRMQSGRKEFSKLKDQPTELYEEEAGKAEKAVHGVY